MILYHHSTCHCALLIYTSSTSVIPAHYFVPLLNNVIINDYSIVRLHNDSMVFLNTGYIPVHLTTTIHPQKRPIHATTQYHHCPSSPHTVAQYRYPILSLYTATLYCRSMVQYNQSAITPDPFSVKSLHTVTVHHYSIPSPCTMTVCSY